MQLPRGSPAEIGRHPDVERGALTRTSMLSTSLRRGRSPMTITLAPISFRIHGGFNDHPDPAGHRDRLLPGPSSRPLAGRLGAAPDDPRITSWLVRQHEPAARPQVTQQVTGTGSAHGVPVPRR